MKFYVVLMCFCLAGLGVTFIGTPPQTAQQILDANDYSDYIPPYWKEFGPIMQWQSVVLFPVQHVQIDLRVNAQELKVLQYEHQMILRDLYRFYYGYPRDAFEVVRRGYWVDIHTAANPYPHHRMYKQKSATTAIRIDVANPYNGFTYRAIGKAAGANKMGMAVKVLGPDSYHVSYAMFMEFAPS